MATDAPDWLPSTQLSIGNAYLVGAGGNSGSGFQNIAGVPASGLVINAPPSNLAIAVYSIVGTIQPAAGNGNRLELKAFTSYPGTWFDLVLLQWNAGATPQTLALYLGGFIMQAGQPLGYTVTTAALSDIFINVHYRLVTP